MRRRARAVFDLVADALEEVDGAEVPGADVLPVADVEVDNLNEEARLGLDVRN